MRSSLRSLSICAQSRGLGEVVCTVWSRQWMRVTSGTGGRVPALPVKAQHAPSGVPAMRTYDNRPGTHHYMAEGLNAWSLSMA